MKSMATAITAVALVLTAVPAFAVDTTKVYSSGILVLVFLGICALFVVSQMIPAIILLIGTVKGMFRNRRVAAMAEANKEHLG